MRPTMVSIVTRLVVEGIRLGFNKTNYVCHFISTAHDSSVRRQKHFHPNSIKIRMLPEIL